MTTQQLDDLRSAERAAYNAMEATGVATQRADGIHKDATDIWRRLDEQLRKALDEWRYR